MEKNSKILSLMKKELAVKHIYDALEKKALAQILNNVRKV